MTDALSGSDSGKLEAEPMVAVYRHDAHKLRGRGHEAAKTSIGDIVVNESVPYEADRDAALLSRPRGEPEQTVTNHESPYRLSLITGDPATQSSRVSEPAAYMPLLMPTDPEELHARWLLKELPGVFSESPYYPYTSLKYHTLLTAALLAAYRNGYEFADLALVAGVPQETEDFASWVKSDLCDVTNEVDSIRPHETVLWTPELALHLTAHPGDRPTAPVNGEPARRFGQVWSQLSNQPLDVDNERKWRVLDGQLRRLGSWSTALAYIDEFVRFWPGGENRGGLA